MCAETPNTIINVKIFPLKFEFMEIDDQNLAEYKLW